jgi:hypothetical protein
MRPHCETLTKKFAPSLLEKQASRSAEQLSQVNWRSPLFQIACDRLFAQACNGTVKHHSGFIEGAEDA